jgi:O-antigen ligase
MISILLLIGFAGRLALTRSKWRKSVLDSSVLIVLFAMALSLSGLGVRGSQYFNDTLVLYVRLISMMALSIIIYQIINIQDAIKTLAIFTIATGFISLLGILGLITATPSVRIGGLEMSLYKPWGGVEARLGGIYEQPNTFGAILTLAFPLGIALSLLNKRILGKILWALDSIICMAGLLVSQSRSAILGAVLGTFIMVVTFAKIYKRPHYIVAILLVSVGAISLVMATGMLEPVFMRLNWNYYVHQQVTSTEPSRLEIWIETLRLAFNNPLGYGAETKYMVGLGLGVWEKSIHNVFLSFLIGMGVLGFIGAIVLAITPLINLWKLAFEDLFTEYRVLAAGLFSGLIGFWIFNLAHSVIHWMAIWVYFACVASIIRFGNIKDKR